MNVRTTNAYEPTAAGPKPASSVKRSGSDFVRKVAIDNKLATSLGH